MFASNFPIDGLVGAFATIYAAFIAMTAARMLTRAIRAAIV